jgi:hypothetical protein
MHTKFNIGCNRPTHPGTPPGVLLSAASGDSSVAPVNVAATSQLARVLTSGVLVAQVTGSERTFRVLSNELRLSRFLDL